MASQYSWNKRLTLYVAHKVSPDPAANFFSPLCFCRDGRPNPQLSSHLASFLILELQETLSIPWALQMLFFLPKRFEVQLFSRLGSSHPRALILNIPASERFSSMTQSQMLSSSALLTFGTRAIFAVLCVVGLSAASLTLPTRCP